MKIQIRDKCASCGARLERRKIAPFLPMVNGRTREGVPFVTDHPAQKYATECPYGCGAAAFRWNRR